MRSDSHALNPSLNAEAPRSDLATPVVDVHLNGSTGRVRIRDAQLFQPDRRDFDKKLIEHLCKSFGVTRAEIDWNSLRCEVDFDLSRRNGSNPLDFMAGIVVQSVRSASNQVPNSRGRSRSGGRSIDQKRSKLTAYPSSNSRVSIWETFVDQPDRVELVHSGAADRRVSRARLAEEIAQIPGVTRCEIARFSRRIKIDRTNDAPVSSRLVDSIERIIQGREPDSSREAQADTAAVAVIPKNHAYTLNTTIEPARGLKKWKYLALAGGSFVLSICGLIIPGVPTVPFLLATSYYLARSSPKLNDRLLHTRFFGSILRDWESRSALSPLSKLKLVGLTFAVVLATIVFLPVSPIAFVLIAIMVSLSLIGIARTPTILEADSAVPQQLPSQDRKVPVATPA